MKISVTKDSLLKPLQAVCSVVERRQTLPVLSNILVVTEESHIVITGTDLEVELVAKVEAQIESPGEVTLPAKKLLDIVKNLPDEKPIVIEIDDAKAKLRCDRSRFSLATLPANDFPTLDDIGSSQVVKIPGYDFRELIDRTHFSMALQDVRYYLNGLLIELTSDWIRAVATDGHRLALSEKLVPTSFDEKRQVILPRKGVQELLRLLSDRESEIDIELGTNHIRVDLEEIRFTSKLIDGRFPDYERVIPFQSTTVIAMDRLTVKDALVRVAILSNDKFKGIRFGLKDNFITVQAHNPEQEEAEEKLEVDYSGAEIEIGFNVNYLIDAINAVTTNNIMISLTDSNSSCLLFGEGDEQSKYVVMPMRL